MQPLRQFVAVVFALWVLATSPTVAAATQIAASGEGVVLVSPDTASIRAQVSAINQNGAIAQKRVSQRMDTMLSALDSYSVVVDSLDTSALSLQPEYRWNRETEQQVFTGYRVTRTLTFKTDDLEAVGELLTALTEAGATQISPPQFESSTSGQAQESALEQAVKSATRKLDVLARSAGLSLQSIASIAEASAVSPLSPEALMRTEVSMDDARNNFVIGNLTFRAEVLVKGVAN
jgi:uncharacterized protein YggE